jgi:hypothetical protein
MKSTVFWDIKLCIPFKGNQNFGENVSILLTAFALVSCSTYSSTLKMEVICSSVISVDFQHTAWCYITGDSVLYFCKIPFNVFTSHLQNGFHITADVCPF